MSAPRVSVVLPVWNREAYLEPAVESVLEQTLGDLELIAVDDGSTDGSLRLLEALAARDGRVRVLARPHAGQSAARNAALGAARGEWIAFQDSDDLWSPRHLEVLAAALEAAPPVVGVAYGDYRIFPDGARPDDPTTWFPYRASPRSGAVLAELARSNFISPIAALVRREAFEAAGLWLDEGRRQMEDWDLFLRLARTHQVLHVPEVVTYVRFHEGNMSHDVVVGLEEALSVVAAACARCGPDDPERPALLAALAWHRLSLSRRLLEASRFSEARVQLRRALEDGCPRRLRALALGLLGLSAVPGARRAFGPLHAALLDAARRVPWGRSPSRGRSRART